MQFYRLTFYCDGCEAKEVLGELPVFWQFPEPEPLRAHVHHVSDRFYSIGSWCFCGDCANKVGNALAKIFATRQQRKKNGKEKR